MLRRVLRIRGGALVGALVILAVAATIAAGAGEIMAEALGAPGAGRFAHADAVVQANPTFRMGGENGDNVTARRSALLPAADVTRVGALSGVRSAVGDLAFPVTVGNDLPTRGGAPAQAHGWDSAPLTPYRLIRGSAPVGPGEVAIDAGLAAAGSLQPGQPVRVATPSGPVRLRVSGIVQAPRAIRSRASAVFFSAARARMLSGTPGGVDAIAVRFAPGVDGARERARIAAALGTSPLGASVVRDRRHAAAADAGDVSAYDRSDLVAVLASGAGLIIGVAILIVAGTIAFAVRDRRREIASVRAIGATPRQVRRALLASVALVGLAGGVAGCAVATVLLGRFVDVLISVGLAPRGFHVTLSLLPYAIAIGADIAAAVCAAALAAHRATRIRPGEALVDSALPERRLGVVRALAGLAAIGGGITLVVTLAAQTLQYATLDALCFMIGVALLSPLLLGRPVALLGRLLLPPRGAGFLASAGLAAGRFRIGAAGAAVALVVALTGTQVVALATVQRAVNRDSAARVRAPQVIVSSSGGLPASLAASVARLPRTAATGMVATQIYLLDHHLTNGDDAWDAAGLDLGSARRTLALGVTAGSLGAVRGRAIAVSSDVARTGHIGVGSQLRARLADGTPVLLRVAAVFRRAGGLGDVVLPMALALPHASASVQDAVFASGPASPGAARILRALVGAVPGARLVGRRQYLAGVHDSARQDADSQWVIDALMILLTVLAAFNTGWAAAAERRRELGLARLAGATRGQLTRALGAESLLSTVAGLAAGVGVIFACFADASHDLTGGPLALPPGQLGLVLGGGAVLGLAGQLIPAAFSRTPRPALVAAASSES